MSFQARTTDAVHSRRTKAAERLGWDCTHEVTDAHWTEYPGHDRRRADPLYTPVYAAISRWLNRGKTILKVIK